MPRHPRNAPAPPDDDPSLTLSDPLNARGLRGLLIMSKAYRFAPRSASGCQSVSQSVKHDRGEPRKPTLWHGYQVPGWMETVVYIKG